MTAEEARKKTDQANLILAEAEFALCMEKIETEISRGNYVVNLSDHGQLYPQNIKKLTDLGYKVQGGCRILWTKVK